MSVKREFKCVRSMQVNAYIIICYYKSCLLLFILLYVKIEVNWNIIKELIMQLPFNKTNVIVILIFWFGQIPKRWELYNYFYSCSKSSFLKQYLQAKGCFYFARFLLNSIYLLRLLCSKYNNCTDDCNCFCLCNHGNSQINS